MKKIFHTFILLLIVSVAFGQKETSSKKSDSQPPFKGFKMTEGGLYYKIKKGKNSGAQVKLDDIISIDIKYTTDDTVLYDSKMSPEPTQLQVGPPAYSSDLMGGFVLMHVGDEGVFKTPIDSFFRNIVRMELPEYLKTGTYLTFEITMLKAQTIDELKAEQEAMNLEYKNKEMDVLKNYVIENNISAQPTESGLYYIETLAGIGKRAKAGDQVSMHYTGLLLSGEKFDSSLDRNEPFIFTLGIGQVIPGFDEGISLMSVGGKATLLIPSALAYGEQSPQGSGIAPYSTLRFDVELLEATEPTPEDAPRPTTVE